MPNRSARARLTRSGAASRKTFLAGENPVRLEHAIGLMDCLRPVLDVVQNAKREDSVQTSISEWERCGVGHSQVDAILLDTRCPARRIGQDRLCSLDHRRVVVGGDRPAEAPLGMLSPLTHVDNCSIIVIATSCNSKGM